MQAHPSHVTLELKPADAQALLAELEAAGIHAETAEQSQMGGLLESLSVAVPFIKAAVGILVAFLRRKPEARPPVMVIVVNQQNFILELQDRTVDDLNRELESLMQAANKDPPSVSGTAQ